jgi:hypothetical protein
MTSTATSVVMAAASNRAARRGNIRMINSLKSWFDVYCRGKIPPGRDQIDFEEDLPNAAG